MITFLISDVYFHFRFSELSCMRCKLLFPVCINRFLCQSLDRRKLLNFWQKEVNFLPIFAKTREGSERRYWIQNACNDWGCELFLTVKLFARIEFSIMCIIVSPVAKPHAWHRNSLQLVFSENLAHVLCSELFNLRLWVKGSMTNTWTNSLLFKVIPLKKSAR